MKEKDGAILLLALTSTPTIFGIISPPFSDKYHFHANQVAISASLYNEALSTTVPARRTGASSATGVIAPVLPTW